MQVKHSLNIAARERLLSRAVLCERWHCSRETLKRQEKSKFLTALRIGQKVKYRLSEIVAIEREAEVA